MAQHYDAMVQPAVALQRGTATPEAIRRRCNSSTVTQPTSKAFAAWGQAGKTSSRWADVSALDLRDEGNEGVHGVERWHAAKDLLCSGRQGLFATQSREQQETTTRWLQLLHNGLRRINTLLVERRITPHQLLEPCNDADRRALTPLFYAPVHPYGLFALPLDQPSFLEAA